LLKGLQTGLSSKSISGHLCFRNAICNTTADLIWVLTTGNFADTHFGFVLVDRIRPCRFALREPYGWDLETPFSRRCPAAREAVIAAMILVMRGSRADRALGVCGTVLGKTAEFRPFIEVLQAIRGKEDAFWEHVRTWPGDIQNRAGAALDYLRPERARPFERGRKREDAMGTKIRLPEDLSL
jgi:hypothetical protein